MKPLSVVIAASGSGGHLFPALHIARAFQRENPQTKILFIGSGRPLESNIIDREGFAREVIQAQPVMQRGVKGLLKFVLTLPQVLLRTLSIVRRAKPDLIIGVGGYASVPPVLAGTLLRIPTMVHEAELRPGLANRFLSLFASRVTLAFESAQMPWYARTVFTGHPVRQELLEIARDPIRPDAPKRILVTGGSQGARGIDEGMAALAPELARLGVMVLHQTRPENLETVETIYSVAGVNAKVVPFVQDMPAAYRDADLLIARSGAGTVAEIEVVNRPTIFVPYPRAQGGHQKANAEVLVAQGKAVLVEEGAGFVPALQRALHQLLVVAEYRRMRELPVRSRGVNAADRIVAVARELLAGS